MIFLLPIFLIADLYEFNPNNCLQPSRSTKFCMFFSTKAQSAHTCVVALSPDSLIVKYFMTLCMFERYLSYSLSECGEATQTSLQVRSPELKST